MKLAPLIAILLAGAAGAATAAPIEATQVSCVVLPSQHLNVASTVPGIVRAVHVDRGAYVRRGQVLLDLSSDLELAQEKLAATKADMMKRKLDRNAEAIQKHLISDQERDQLESDAKVAQQEYEVAHRTVTQKTTVSPIDGVVVSRKAEPGQYVGTDPAFELVALNPLNVELVFRVDAYGKIRPGGTALVDLGSPINGERRATVAIVDKVIDARSGTFLVRDDKVVIIDENTGRPMPDRNWEQGLHQLIELKEAVTPTYAHETLSRLSFQRFFRLYHHLGGMTGTAREVTGELWSCYGLGVRPIPTHRPSRLKDQGAQVLDTTEAKWERVAERAAELNATGQPVLIGTRTVGASEALSEVMTRRGLPHQVLNARQDLDEAKIVARAGEHGALTIATNMAGRGTDIKLGPGVEELGGLHVIVTELHESGRLDRQLIGRSARQGDPGSFEIICSLDDLILTNNAPRLADLIGRFAEGRGRTRWALALMRLQQWRAGRFFAARRAELLKADELEADAMSFAGRLS